MHHVGNGPIYKKALASYNCSKLLITSVLFLQICDGVIDCHDLSDECLCPEATRPPICRNLCTRPDRCQMKTFTCGNFTRNISDICNRQIDCPDGEDELYCRKFASSSLMSCPGNKKNTTTLTAFKCDGRPECYDLSDECRAGCLHEAPFCSLASRYENLMDLFDWNARLHLFSKLDKRIPIYRQP